MNTCIQDDLLVDTLHRTEYIMETWLGPLPRLRLPCKAALVIWQHLVQYFF